MTETFTIPTQYKRIYGKGVKPTLPVRTDIDPWDPDFLETDLLLGQFAYNVDDKIYYQRTSEGLISSYNPDFRKGIDLVDPYDPLQEYSKGNIVVFSAEHPGYEDKCIYRALVEIPAGDSPYITPGKWKNIGEWTDTLEGEVNVLEELKKTADGLEQKFTSQIQQSADQINLAVREQLYGSDGILETIQSSIQERADSILLSVNKKIWGDKNDTGKPVSEEYKSAIQIMSDSISLSVDGKISNSEAKTKEEYTSAITISKEEIDLSVDNKITDSENGITQAYTAAINVQAGRISLVVDSTSGTDKVRAGVIVDAINGDSTVTIAADRVNIAGAAIFTDIDNRFDTVNGDISTLNQDVLGKLDTGSAAADINGHVTTINGGKITAGTITSLGLVESFTGIFVKDDTAPGDKYVFGVNKSLANGKVYPKLYLGERRTWNYADPVDGASGFVVERDQADNLYKFHIGNSVSFLNYDGTNLRIAGATMAAQVDGLLQDLYTVDNGVIVFNLPIASKGAITARATVTPPIQSFWAGMPYASATVLGGLKLGANLTYNPATQQVDASGGGVSSWNALNDKPAWLLPTTLTDFQNTHGHAVSKITGLATVATTGAYGNLSGVPDLSVYQLASTAWNTGNLNVNYLVQGSNNSRTSVVNADANTQTTSGFYYYNTGSVNVPSVGNLLHLGYDNSAGWSSQLLIGEDKKFYFRRAVSTTWQPWNEVWHSGNFNPASKQDASTAWNTGNFNPGNYYPISTLPNGGYLGLPSNPSSTNKFSAGTGDGASYSTYNIALGGWYGMGIINESSGGSYPYGTVGYLNFREGVLDMKGGFRVNGSMVYHTGNLNRSDTDFTANNINLNGSINIKNYTAINFSSIENSSSYWQIFSDNLSGSYAGANGLSIYGNGASRLAITSGGNVGIGTTSPNNKLQIQQGGAVSYTGNDLVLANSNGQTAFKNESGEFYIYTSEPEIALYHSNGSKRTRFDGNGQYLNGWFRNINSTEGLYNEANQTGIYSDAYKQMRIYNGAKFVVDNEVTSYGSNAGFFFQNRTSSNLYGWYATNNEARLYNGDIGSILTVSSVGNTIANGHLMSNYGQIHSKDNGSGSIELATYQGSLPGYPSSYYATLKSNNAIFLSANGYYSGYIENQNLFMYGNISAGGSLTARSSTSDRRLKYNIQPLQSELQNILQLNTVSYNRLDKGDFERGMIADEVKKIYPELVYVYDNNTGYEAIHYDKLSVLNTKAIQELYALSQNQAKEIIQLRQELETLRRRAA